MAATANRLELLQIADAVAREKNIEREIVLKAMEDSIARAAKSRYGLETEIRVEINPVSGDMKMSRLLNVIEDIENPAFQISLADAKLRNPAAEYGDWIAETLPPLDLGRVAAQAAKQVIVQKVREAERDRLYDEFKGRVGDIIHGIVKRIEYGNVVVELGRGEAIIRRDELIPREALRNGDRVRAYVYDVRREQRGPQIFLSRTHPQFMAKLFMQEVPEVYEGTVEIKAVARDPGSRAKMAVISRDASIDPVGTCIGMRGSRVQAVVQELQGEKVDVIHWSPDIAVFVINALTPAEVVRVRIDEDNQKIGVVVPDAQLSLAIGRRGQNVRLASQVTGWDIDIMTEQEDSDRRQVDFEAKTKLFIAALDVDETVAQLLTSEGYGTIEDLAYGDVEEIGGIEGFDPDIAAELSNRAKDYLDNIEINLDNERKALGAEDALREIDGLTLPMIIALAKADIKTVEDLAGAVSDDLIGYSEKKGAETIRHKGVFDAKELSRVDADALIMTARVKAGWIDAPVHHDDAEEV
jgi:transcription termination/antitermination protein NusA